MSRENLQNSSMRFAVFLLFSVPHPTWAKPCFIKFLWEEEGYKMMMMITDSTHTPLFQIMTFLDINVLQCTRFVWGTDAAYFFEGWVSNHQCLSACILISIRLILSLYIY